MSPDISLEQRTAAEKLALMERLWVDLSQHPEDVPSPCQAGDVLEQRGEAVRQGRTSFIPWEEARQRILDRHG